MRYYRTLRGSPSLVIEQDGTFYDATGANELITSYRDLVHSAGVSGCDLDELSREVCSDAPTLDRTAVLSDLALPVQPDEVWGAGVTYAISQEARQEEEGLGETYLNAYEADRPEVYFKATPSRTVGPDEDVGIRGDSNWDVPEPELSVVIYEGEIVGVTAGIDMCSREIERENLLYLPQSKIYRKCCAIGPCVAQVEDPHDLKMRMTIERDGTQMFDETTATSEMVRSIEELTEFFRRHNEVPEMTVLLTGTSIVPPKDFTLAEGDVVRVEIEDIGTLRNTVTVV